jgi:hypothetical protein
MCPPTIEIASLLSTRVAESFREDVMVDCG